MELQVFAEDSGYIITAEGVGRVTVDRSGAHLRAEVFADAPTGAMDELLSESILPMVHQLSGAPSLHASCVAIGDRAAAFIGRSHSGKSTLAAILASRGARLLGDDCARLHRSGSDLFVEPHSTAVRLRSESAGHLAAGHAGMSWDGRTLLRLPIAEGPVRLGGLFFLQSADTSPARIAPIGPRDAIARLAANLHRLNPREPALLRNEFLFLEEVVAATTVADLFYERTFDSAREAASLVETAVSWP